MRGAEAGPDVEAARLTRLSYRHTYFRATGAKFIDAIRTGSEHGLIGADHLLFLLTVLVAGFGARHWLGVVTAFTLAHSLTLALATLGYVRLPAGIVEPAIAASIVPMALDNLRGQRAPRQRIALVAVCGLLHGLSFAGSWSLLGLDTSHRLVGLVGFNLGVELGQELFLITMLAAVMLGKRLMAPSEPPTLTRFVSIAASVIGAYRFVARVVG